MYRRIVYQRLKPLSKETESCFHPPLNFVRKGGKPRQGKGGVFTKRSLFTFQRPHVSLPYLCATFGNGDFLLANWGNISSSGTPKAAAILSAVCQEGLRIPRSILDNVAGDMSVIRAN